MLDIDGRILAEQYESRVSPNSIDQKMVNEEQKRRSKQANRLNDDFQSLFDEMPDNDDASIVVFNAKIGGKGWTRRAFMQTDNENHDRVFDPQRGREISLSELFQKFDFTVESQESYSKEQARGILDSGLYTDYLNDNFPIVKVAKRQHEAEKDAKPGIFETLGNMLRGQSSKTRTHITPPDTHAAEQDGLSRSSKPSGPW